MPLIPLGLYLTSKALAEGYVLRWYFPLWCLLILPGLAQTVRAGNKMSPRVRAIHSFASRLSKTAFKSARILHWAFAVDASL